MYKILITGNYFYIVDIDAGNIEYEGLAKEVKVKRLNTTSQIFTFSNVNSWDSTKRIDFADIDLTGAPYSDLATFLNWYRTETGKSSGGGDGVGVASVTGYGVDNTDPDNPVIFKPKSLFLQASQLSDIVFPLASVNYIIPITNTDDSNGISITSNEIIFSETGVYSIFAQPQITHIGTGANRRFDMYLQWYNGTVWQDIQNSNAYIRIDPNESLVLPIDVTIDITNASYKVRIIGRVNDTDLILEYDTTTPNTPAIILSVKR